MPETPPIPDPPEVRLDRLEAALAALGDAAELRARVDQAMAKLAALENMTPAPPSLRSQSQARTAPSPVAMATPTVAPERHGRPGIRLDENDETP
jgi:hypothetical protein